MCYNQTIEEMNVRSRLMTRLGYMPWEIDELTLTAATYVFNEKNEYSTATKIEQVREQIEDYKTKIINKVLS